MTRWADLTLRGVALAGAVFPWVFGANATHMFDPDWSPHARPHDAIAVITASGCGLFGVLLLSNAAVRAHPRLYALSTAVGLWPWAGLLLSGLVPGTSFGNPALGTESFRLVGLTLAAPAVAATAFLVLGGAAYIVARPRGEPAA